MATDRNKKRSVTVVYLGAPPKYVKDWIRRRRAPGLLTYVSCKGMADPHQTGVIDDVKQPKTT